MLKRLLIPCVLAGLMLIVNVRAQNAEEAKPLSDEVTYVDLAREEAPKKPKEELNGEEFEEIHYGPKEQTGAEEK